MGLRFSIITPIYVGEDHEKERRLELFPKTIESIKNQTYDKEKFEHIIVNDGSTIPLSIPAYPWIRVVEQSNLQRLSAFNRGFEESKGEIITLLDSDDEYEPDYLKNVDLFYRKYPKYKMFNFGCTHVHKDGVSTQRDAFCPKKKRVGHEVFGGGKIVNGTFVFHRSVFEDLGGYMPSVVRDVDCTDVAYPAHKSDSKPYIRDLFNTSPYDFSAYMQLKYPEIQQFFMTKHPDHPDGLVRELGNPWGQDYALFYMYTRKYHSKAIMGKYLYKVNLK